MFALICSKTEKSGLTGPSVNNNCGMRGILMSILTDFIAFKSSLFKCNGKNSRFVKC